MKCEYCDNALPTGVRECPSCGAAAPEVVAVPPSAVPLAAVPSVTPVAQPSAQPPLTYPQSANRPALKSIPLAVFLGFFPGFGQMYCGRILRGIVLLVGTWILLAAMPEETDPVEFEAGDLFTLVWLITVIVSVFDSLNLAKKFNEGTGG